jgi:hypothetical protein
MLQQRGEQREEADASEQNELTHVELQRSEWVYMDPQLAARLALCERAQVGRLTFASDSGCSPDLPCRFAHTPGDCCRWEKA